MEQQYFGDGVYIEFDGYHYLLAVNDHRNPVLFLDYETAQRLIQYIQENEIENLKP